jgi:hypothetical protein
MRKFFCQCEVCKVEYIGLLGSVRCPDHRPKEIVMADEINIPEQVYSAVPELRGGQTPKVLTEVTTPGHGSILLCSKCGKHPRAAASKSYCKHCHAARVRAWRKKKVKAVVK